MTVEARRIVRASADRVFTHLGRAESFPRYGAPLWMAAEPAEKRRSGQWITLTGYFAGLPVESTLRVSLRPPHLLEFEQTWGTLRAVVGQCALRPVEDGTEVRYRLEVDPGIPMIGDESARQFLVQFLERMLDRIRLAAERKAPARRLERAEAHAPGAGAASLDEEDGELSEAQDTSDAAADARAQPAAHAAGAEREALPSPAARPPVPPAVGRAAPHHPRPGPRGGHERGHEAPAAGTAAEQPGAPSKSRRRRRRRHRGRPGGTSGRGERTERPERPSSA